MINFNENENDTGKIDLVNRTQIGLDVDVETDIQDIACPRKTMPLCIKRRLSNTWGSIH